MLPRLSKAQQVRNTFVFLWCGLTNRRVACSKPLGLSGNGTAGKYTSKGVTVKEDEAIIAARGYMHVYSTFDPFHKQKAKRSQDKGNSMTVFINDKKVCVSNAEYNTFCTGELANNGKKWTTNSKISHCNNVILVKNGNIIKLVARTTRENISCACDFRPFF